MTLNATEQIAHRYPSALLLVSRRAGAERVWWDGRWWDSRKHVAQPVPAPEAAVLLVRWCAFAASAELA
jgi:hypothetical protein